MADESRVNFSSSVAGYNKSEVDARISSLTAELSKLEQYNSMAVREQATLRERITQLEESLKLAKSPGYAQVGAQFEQTLRLAETEAARLVNDASRDSLKIRGEAKAEAEAIIFEAQTLATETKEENERLAKNLLAVAKRRSTELSNQAERELEQAAKERTSLEKQANVIRSEADNYAATVKAELQTEVEKIQNANSNLLKKNAHLEAEIARKLDEGEKQALEIFRKVEAEAMALKEQAEAELAAATAEASSLIENAEETLFIARKEADRISNEATSISLNLITDAKHRAESLAVKSLDLTRDAISEAEYRLSKLPAQQNAIEEFLRETQNLLTPQQQVILARRNSIEKNNQPALEDPEILSSDS